MLLRETPAQSPLAPARMVGRVSLGYRAERGRTRLHTLDHRGPLRVLFPTPSSDEPPQAVITTTSGGLTGGDQLTIQIEAEAGSRVTALGQAAEKIYRSLGADTRVAVELTVGDGAWLEWLPQETILFDKARLDRRTTVDVAGGGQLLAAELVVLGRQAHAEQVREGLLVDRWRVRRDGRLIWADHQRFDGAIHEMAADPTVLGGARSFATLLLVSPEAPSHVAACRDSLMDSDDCHVGVSARDGILIVRLVSHDPLALRRAFALQWAGLRHRAGGLPARMPRLWDI